MTPGSPGGASDTQTLEAPLTPKGAAVAVQRHSGGVFEAYGNEFVLGQRDGRVV